MSQTEDRARRKRRSNPEAAMPLVEHLRELRGRLFICAIAIGIGSAIAWWQYEWLIAFLRHPWDEFQSNPGHSVDVPDLTITGIAAPFTLQLRVSVLGGVVLSSPIWLYQLWAFVTPGLRRKEKRWTIVFMLFAVPLFFAGCAMSYLFMPRALDLLIGFTPEKFTNLITVDEYMSFVTRLLIVFGVAFLLPVFVVMLNVVGVLSAKRLRSWWRGITLGVFFFAAIATPTGDPWTMLALAVPLCILLFIAFGIAWLNDRRRIKKGLIDDYDDDLDDETASPLNTTPSPVDDPRGNDE